MNDKRFQKKLDKIEKCGERQKAIYELESQYAEYYPHKSGKKVSNIMLAIVVIAIVGYVIASFALQYHTSVEISSTLTTCWFSFWGAEILALAGIRISKVRKENYSEDVFEEEFEHDEEEV